MAALDPGSAIAATSALDLCQPFLHALPVSGVSVTVINTSRSQASLCSSDSLAARIDELQFELGEGPQWTATGSGNLVAVPDVTTDALDDWPIFGSAVRELAIGALFAVPMKMGAAVVGAVTMYRTQPGDLGKENRSSALAIASAIAGAAVHRAMLSAADEDGPESAIAPALRREVHQATGMLLVQLDTTATIAYARLQAFAFAHGRAIQDVARDVVNGDLTFDQ